MRVLAVFPARVRGSVGEVHVAAHVDKPEAGGRLAQFVKQWGFEGKGKMEVGGSARQRIHLPWTYLVGFRRLGRPHHDFDAHRITGDGLDGVAHGRYGNEDDGPGIRVGGYSAGIAAAYGCDRRKEYNEECAIGRNAKRHEWVRDGTRSVPTHEPIIRA